ncbi:MAG: hypothetical protein ACJ72O_06375 [Marmoricola sp.]
MILELLPLSFASVGIVVSLRQPANRIGWVCLAIGLLLSIDAGSYGSFGRNTGSAPLPGAGFATWLGDWIWLPAIGSVGTFLLLLFPDGRLPSRRWRAVAWTSAGVIALAVLAEAFQPGMLSSAPGVANPYAVEAAKYIPGRLPGGANVFLAPCFAAAAASLVLRFRRATGRQRLQIKWFATAAALLALLFAFAGVANLVAELLDAGRPLTLRLLEDAVSASAAGLPLAIGIAVLRHDLYEIDVVINRTLVYGALTGTLAATYLGSVLLLQLVLSRFTAGSSLAIAASTLAVAALFGPARTRIQAVVDRRFFRNKYDAHQTLERFGTRLRDQVDLSDIGSDLIAVVTETVQPSHLSLWLRPANGETGDMGLLRSDRGR